jgi:hypothetical protein
MSSCCHQCWLCGVPQDLPTSSVPITLKGATNEILLILNYQCYYYYYSLLVDLLLLDTINSNSNRKSLLVLVMMISW